MIIANTDYIAGKKISETLGIVKGSTVRAKHIGKDIFAMIKQIIGGEIKGYTEMINEARDEAMQRMIAEAKRLKADAIVNVRFTTSDVMQGSAEVLAYGTAVKLGK